jgi:hypothetical protein
MSGAITAGTLATVAGIGAAGSIGAAAIGANAAGSAADKQMQAAQQAAQLQQQGSTSALNYQNGIYGQTEQNLNPYINAGGGALNQLQYLLGVNPTNTASMVQGAQPLQTNQTNAATATPSMSSVNSGLTSGFAPGTSGITPQAGAAGMTPSMGSINSGLTSSPSIPQSGAVAGIQGGGINGGINSGLTQGGSAPAAGSSPAGGGFGSLLQHYGQFVAPDALTEQNDPGYKARLKLGTDAIERSAAARGGVLTGGTGKALDQFGQDYGSNEYQNVYNRALQGYGTNYGVWNNDNNNIYGRLTGLAGMGQNASTALGSFGQSSSNNVTGNLLGTGAQIGQDYGAGAAANASGIVGGANAWSGALGGTSNNLQQLLLLKQLGMGGAGGGTGGA